MTYSDNNCVYTNGFMISGITGVITTGILPCFGMKTFSVLTEGVITGVVNANGTTTLQAQVHPSSSWTTIQSLNFNGSSGVLTQFVGPYFALRGTVSTYSGGAFNISYMAMGA